MRKIAVLDQNTIDKIAAGEVVERPASVVKELVENAIDAGATAITVEIKEGGIAFIRVTDNGGGIEKEQVPLAFLRHATSKIERVEDLLQISSLGFRGEALSSISAVSQMEVITKTGDALTGVRYVIEGGREKLFEEVGAPNGTTMLVRNLFFNTPARAKFLKTAMTEAGYVSGYMEQLALSHQDISFKYMVNGQTKLHTSGNSNLKDVIYGIYGRDITREAYKPYMMQHKYPFVCLHYEIQGEEIDVNVHPTKMEVRFQNQGAVYNATYDMITEALSKREMIPEVKLEKSTEKKEEKITVPEPFETGYKKQAKQWENQIREPKSRYMETERNPGASVEASGKLQPKQEKEVFPTGLRPAVARLENSTEEQQEGTAFAEEKKDAGNSLENDTPAASENAVVQAEKPVQMELFDDRLLSKKSRVRHRIIGQLFDTYWLVEFDNKFYIIDQHAAHEKVLYERFMKEFANREIVTQMISPPQVVSLNLQEDLLLKTHMELFQRFGFEISEFGGREYSIHGVPANLYGVSVQDFFVELLDSLENENTRQPLDILTGRIATAACKAAVKGNNMLSVQEADKLIDELLGLENPYHCPHGRPTIISMTKYELEKKFKRIV